MQTTKISLYSLRCLLKDKINGYATVGYTVRPGFSNGLMLTDRKAFGQYVGF